MDNIEKLRVSESVYQMFVDAMKQMNDPDNVLYIKNPKKRWEKLEESINNGLTELQNVLKYI